MSYDYAMESISTQEQRVKEIICTSYHKFEAYRIQSKSKAMSLGIWRYMQDDDFGPNTSMTDPEPTLPQRPAPPSPPEIEVDEKIWQVYTRQQTIYNSAITTWTADLREYEKFERSKLHWKTYLNRTIPAMYLSELNDLNDTLAAWWEFITMKLAPQEEVRISMLSDEHNRLMQGPKSDDMEYFFMKWLDLQSRMRRCYHPLTVHLKNNFCRMFEEKVDLTQGRITASKESLQDVIEDCRRFIQRRPGKVRLRTSHSEVVASNANFEFSTPQNTSTKSRGCGKFTGKPKDKQCDNLAKCDIVNHRKRPDEDEMSLEQRRYLATYMEYLKEHPSWCRQQAEKYRDPLAKAIQRRDQPRSTQGKREEREPSTRRRVVGEVDDVYVNSTVVRANAARVSTLQDDLLLDSGSNAHIINDVQIGDFRPKSIPNDVTILTGNVELKAVVKGDLTITLIAHDGQQIDLAMENVLYVPGYHTNIVSEPLMRKRGLYLDGKTDTWFNKDDEKITTIVRKEDLPYLNFIHRRKKGENTVITAWPTDAKGDPRPVSEVVGS
jgi:hypothetical protein